MICIESIAPDPTAAADFHVLQFSLALAKDKRRIGLDEEICETEHVKL